VLSASTPASAGVDLSALYIVEHNIAAVMSESYGACENVLGAAGNAFYSNLWEQAARKVSPSSFPLAMAAPPVATISITRSPQNKG